MKEIAHLKKKVVIEMINYMCEFIRNVETNNPCALWFDGKYLTIFPVKFGTGDIKQVKLERRKNG